jgi:hypothetical protein
MLRHSGGGSAASRSIPKIADAAPIGRAGISANSLRYTGTNGRDGAVQDRSGSPVAKLAIYHRHTPFAKPPADDWGTISVLIVVVG